jgi:phosphatidylglycerol---prolipoprotein diacylglyceryl transferase
MKELQSRLLYAIVMLLAIIAAIMLVQLKQQRLALNDKQRVTIGLSAFLGAMLGAKLPFLLDRDWSGVVSPTLWLSDGKTILGGIFGGYLAVEIAKRIWRIQVRTGDSFALPIAVSVAIGRVGCFVAGCCFGCITELPWGMRFEVANDSEGISRHPTQLYECLFHVLCASCIVVAENYKWMEGSRLKVYLLCYLTYRFVTEWLRPEPITSLGLTTYQVACVVLGACLIGLWLSERRTSVSAVA